MDMPAPTAPAVFCRLGRTYQLRIENAHDLRAALELDDAHWMTTSARIASFAMDEAFLHYVDSTGDGRIRAREVRRSLRFLLTHLTDYTAVDAGRAALSMDAIDATAEHGATIRDASRKIVGSDATMIDLDAVQMRIAEEVERGFSEAGLLVPAKAARRAPAAAELLEAVLATVGGVPHPEVEGDAVQAEDIARFYRESEAYLEWLGRASEHASDRDTLLPLGDDTRAAWAAIDALNPKLRAWFALCDATKLDPTIRTHVWPKRDNASLQFESTETIEAYVREAPLSVPKPSGVLTREDPINPAWTDDVDVVFGVVVPSVLGPGVTGLDRAGWQRILTVLQSYAAWSASRPETSVHDLGADVLSRLLAGREALAETLVAAFVRSHEGALEVDNARLVERLLLLSEHMLRFANSFISFRDLYAPEARALFEEGTFVVDGRHLNLAVQVFDRERHKAFSDSSNMFVLYIHVGESIGGDDFVELAVPVTSGGRGTLITAKHGVFHLTDGRELLATIVDIVDNPISLAEAIAAPFKRLGSALTRKIEEIGEAGEERLTAGVTDAVAVPADAASDAKAENATAESGKGSLFAGGAIGVAALGSAIAFITKTLAGLQVETILGIILGIIAIVLLPIAALAWFRLNRRDLSALLEGSGFGVNARMRLTMKLAREFTRRPPLPQGAAVTTVPRWVWWGIGLISVGGIGVLIYFLTTG